MLPADQPATSTSNQHQQPATSTSNQQPAPATSTSNPLRAAHGPHYDPRPFKPGSELLRELRGVGTVAVDADRIDADRDGRTIHRRDRAFPDHSDRAGQRLAGVVDVGIGSTS